MAHRERLMSSLVTHLILRDRIETTLPKAKQAKRDAEKMVTLARKGTLASRRLAASRLHSPEAVGRLFDQVVPALAGRPGGYTRITKLGPRFGDAAEMCVLEWVAPIAPAAAPAETPEDASKATKAPKVSKEAASKA
jgi:large subunit ribosomal protein L17